MDIYCICDIHDNRLPFRFNEVISLSEDGSGRKTIPIVPNDIVVCDANGVMIVPNGIIDKVIKIANLREMIEEVIIDCTITNKKENNELVVEDCYPFQTPLATNSKVEQLLKEKGMLDKVRNMEQEIFNHV